MPKGEYDTPGPFDRHPRGHVRKNGAYILTLSGSLDDSRCDELVSLLNKGTHFEGMLEALKVIFEWEYQFQPDEYWGHKELIERAKNAMAKIQGKDDDQD